MHVIFATETEPHVSEKFLEWVRSRRYGKNKNWKPWIREIKMWDVAMYESLLEEFIKDLKNFGDYPEDRMKVNLLQRLVRHIIPLKPVDISNDNKYPHIPKNKRTWLGAPVKIMMFGKVEDRRNRFDQEEI